MPTVSVVMPCFNGEQYVYEAACSVLAQTFSDLELIVVDNGSTDKSVDIVGSLQESDPRVKLLSTTDRGAANARNLGIKYAQGKYIAFLDCDDIWHKNKLEVQVEFIKQHDAAFVWSDYNVISEDGNFLRQQLSSCKISYRELLCKKFVIGCLTAMYDSSVFGKQYMPSIAMRQDYGLWLKLLRIAEENNLTCAGLPLVLASYRVHSKAMTHNKVKAAFYQWRLYREVEGLSFTKSLHLFAQYGIRGLLDRQGKLRLMS